MTCVTTPEKKLTHGDASTPHNHCVTTPPPKGGEGVVTRSVGSRKVATHSHLSQQQKQLQ